MTNSVLVSLCVSMGITILSVFGLYQAARSWRSRRSHSARLAMQGCIFIALSQVAFSGWWVLNYFGGWALSGRPLPFYAASVALLMVGAILGAASGASRRAH